jgi:hypothetical protein
LQAGRTLTNKFVPVKGFFQPTEDGPAVGVAGTTSAAGPGAYVRDCLPTTPRPKPEVPPGVKPPQ